jgi:hypothetical protein
MSGEARISGDEVFFRDDTRLDYDRYFCPFNNGWNSNSSNNKRIVFRELHLNPFVGSVTFAFTSAVSSNTYTTTMQVQGKSTTAEIIDFILQSINEKAENPLLSYTLNDTQLAIRSTVNGTMVFSTSLLVFLNQFDLATTTFAIVANTPLVFDEVWNRDIMYFHSSISSCRNQFVNQCNVHYETNFKSFPAGSDSGFWFWFSVDGSRPFRLLYEMFVLEVQFRY